MNWIKNNPEKELANAKNWASKNPEKVKAAHARWRLDSKDNVRADNLRQYGISIEQYNEMFSKQEGRCAICGRHQVEFKKRLAVDHCHKTEAVRGLLCLNCNVGIGNLFDSEELLEAALTYLRSFRKQGL